MLTLNLTEDLNLYGIYVYGLVQICNFGHNKNQKLERSSKADVMVSMFIHKKKEKRENGRICFHHDMINTCHLELMSFLPQIHRCVFTHIFCLCVIYK